MNRQYSQFKSLTSMTEKRKYEKPSIEVYVLKQQPQILAGSNGDIPNNDPYTPDTDPFNF